MKIWPGSCDAGDAVKHHPTMLNWTFTFFIMALIAGAFGFFALVGPAAGIAKILFVIFLILLVVSTFTRGLSDKTR